MYNSKKKLKILHLIDAFELKYERDQIQIVRLCGERGYDTTVITSTFDSDGNLKNKDFFLEGDKSLDYVKIIRNKSFKLKLPAINPLLINVPCKELLNDYDLIHVYSTGSFSFFIAYFVKLLTNAKLVIRAELSQSFYLRIKNSKILKFIILGILAKYDEVYSFTEYERNLLIDLGLTTDKISVIPAGIHTEKFNGKTKSIKNIAIGYLGRFHPIKGPDRLVIPLKKIMNEYPDVAVFFAGPKTDIDYADKIINTMCENTNFKYLGVVKAQELYDLCDIIIIPSRSEVGSNTTVEALSAQKVIIASDTIPMNEYIEHGISGLLVEHDDEIYTYCKQLIENPKLIEEFGKNAKQRSMQYDWKNVFNKIELMYKNVSFL